MTNIWKDKETNKWYESTDFIGTEFIDEITDPETIAQLEECDRNLQEAIESGVFDVEVSD